MPSYARHELVAEGEVGFYHCVTRCVRRAFLCGYDALSKKSFEHRKTWIRERLQEQAAVFGIDVCGYAVMSNHLHLVLRIRPDVVAKWSDEHVMLRWMRLFGKRPGDEKKPRVADDERARNLAADEARCAELRERLCNLSWFMRALCEHVARKANREDACKGRFWEGRFKCQSLLDEAAVLACSMYVDLNPIRAGIASKPEESEYTSAHDRIIAQGERRKQEVNRMDAWLSPVEEHASAETSSVKRASGDGFLAMRLEQYLELLDWTGREIRFDKRGSIPSSLSLILDRMQLNHDTWVESVRHFGKWFGRAAGRLVNLRAAAAKVGQCWFHGVARSKEIFAVASTG